MPPLLVGLGGLGVASLMVSNHFAQVSSRRDAATTAQHLAATLVQRPAHLFRRHCGIFPPAAAASARRRIPAPPRPSAGASSSPRTAGPRSASVRLPAW